MKNLMITAIVAVAACGLGSTATAGDAYDNQIKMAGTLLAGSPAGFRTLCKGVGGTLSNAGDKAKCVRGVTTMMVMFSGDAVNFAMVAYPATPKDIRGLRKKAVEVLGEPDETNEKQLTWQLGDGLFATVSYDDEHSAFSLAQAETKPEPKPELESADEYKAMLDTLAQRLNATGAGFADDCNGQLNEYPGKGEYVGHQFYNCTYIHKKLGLMVDSLDVGPRGMVQSASAWLTGEHDAPLVASIIKLGGKPTKTVSEPGVMDTWVWRFKDATLTVYAYRNLGDTLAQFSRARVSD